MPSETSAILQRGRPAAPSSDYLTELLRLVERDHQRITDLEHAVAQLRQELADEIQRRRVLSSRVDQVER
jgi:hypothetical protein